MSFLVPDQLAGVEILDVLLSVNKAGQPGTYLRGTVSIDNKSFPQRTSYFGAVSGSEEFQYTVR
jgi:hypothetical protein